MRRPTAQAKAAEAGDAAEFWVMTFGIIVAVVMAMAI